MVRSYILEDQSTDPKRINVYSTNGICADKIEGEDKLKIYLKKEQNEDCTNVFSKQITIKPLCKTDYTSPADDPDNTEQENLTTVWFEELDGQNPDRSSVAVDIVKDEDNSSDDELSIRCRGILQLSSI